MWPQRGHTIFILLSFFKVEKDERQSIKAEFIKARIDPLLKLAFSKVCEATGVDASNILRSAVEMYIHQYQQKKGITADISNRGLSRVIDYANSELQLKILEARRIQELLDRDKTEELAPDTQTSPQRSLFDD